MLSREELKEQVMVSGDKVELELLAHIEVLEALLRQVEEALIWTSGSPDFGPGGQAEQGWNRLCRPLIQAIHEHLGEKVLNAKP